MKIRDLTDWMIMPQTIGPQGLIHLPGRGPNNRFDFKNKGNNRANETLEAKFQSALNAEPVQPKREWTAFEMACMEGGHPLPEDAAGVGTITKQNTTKDVKPGDEYKNVKKLHLEFKQFIAEAQQYKGAIFLNDRTAIVGQAHNQTPELSPETLKRVQDIATKYGAYSEGNGADEPYTKAIGITNYRGSWDDLFAGSISGYPWQFIYSIMANVNDNRTWDQIGEDPNKTIFNQILASQQNHNFFTGKRYEGQTLLKFLEEISEGNNNFVEMAKLPATKKNVYEFLKKGESLMFPSNWQSYPYKAGRVAKAANDARDEFLAKRTQGAYFVGDGHLLNIQTLANKKIEENFADGRVKGKSRPGRVKRAGASCKGSVSSLRAKAKNAGGEKAKMYHWCANMKSGRSKK